MRSLILSLLEVGLSCCAMSRQFRGMYGEDLPDSEVEAITKRSVAKASKSRDGSQLRRSDKQDSAQDSILLLKHRVVNSTPGWGLRQKYTPWCHHARAAGEFGLSIAPVKASAGANAK